MRSAIALAAVAATVVSARPNDWAIPCFDGECGYDLPPSTGASGHIRIMGHPNAIADITPAAGWVILDCDPNSLSQDIRLVCMSHDMEDAGCAHFFEGGSPVDKYVRLPEGCGRAGFARISRSWVHRDQSIPHHKRHEITRRDGSYPQVYAISIDDNFDEIDEAKHGEVTFAVAGVTGPGIDMSFDMPYDIKTQKGAEDFTEQALQLASLYYDGAPAKGAAPAAGSEEKDDADSNLLNLDYKKNIDFTGLSLNCEIGNKAKATATVSASLNTSVTGHLKIGVTATGNAAKKSLLSFKGRVAEFSINIDQHLTGKFELKVEIGLKEFEILPPVGIPALSIDLRFVKLGPMFTLLGHVTGSLHLGLRVDAHVVYGLEKSKFEFPGTKELKPFMKDGKFLLEANPEGTDVAELKIGVIPKLKFGLEIFGVKPDIYVSFGGYISGAIKPQKPLAVGTDKKFDLKNLHMCGEIKGILDAHIGAEFQFFSFFKAQQNISLWKKEFDLWKSKECPKAKRELQELNYLDSAPRNLSSFDLVSREVAAAANSAINIPPLAAKWECNKNVDSSLKASIANVPKLDPKILG